jgi:cytoskeletal protein CcmA (bactofilin family)
MSNSVQPNTLFSDVEIKGTIKFQTDLFIDGKVEGEIISPGNLTLGEHADVRGEIKTKSVSVQGNAEANITVEDRCELKAGSKLTGDLKSARLIIEDGATFVGKSEVTPKGIKKLEPPVAPSPANPAEKGK